MFLRHLRVGKLGGNLGKDRTDPDFWRQELGERPVCPRIVPTLLAIPSFTENVKLGQPVLVSLRRCQPRRRLLDRLKRPSLSSQSTFP
jgi:hypothetical protein